MTAPATVEDHIVDRFCNRRQPCSRIDDEMLLSRGRARRTIVAAW